MAFASCISMKVCNGVAVSLAVMAAVAAVVPAVANIMASAMGTVVNCGNDIGRGAIVQSSAQGL